MDAVFPKSGLVKVIFALAAMTATTAAHAQIQPMAMLRSFAGATIVDLASKSMPWRYLDGVHAREAIRFLVDEEYASEPLVIPYRSTASTNGQPEPFALRLLNTRFALTNGSFLRLGSGRRKGASFSVELTY